MNTKKSDHQKNCLRMVHPFLNNKFRTIKKTELKSKKVFAELFGEDKYEQYKLSALYEFQN